MLWTALKSLLGFGAGASVANTAGGFVNYGLLVTGLGWAWVHRDEAVHFEQTLTVGTLVMVVLGVFALIELLRRSAPGVR